MNHTTLDLLACPACHGALQLQQERGNGQVQAGRLDCPACRRSFVIRDGLPHFIEPQALTGPNRRFSRLYDWFSWVYDAWAHVAFAFVGGEDRCRQEVLDHLQPRGRVLEVSIGPGSNLPYLFARPAVREVFGLDISPGQLRQCQGRLRREGWQVDLFLGAAEQLPFRDEVFDAVLHIGGINFFSDKQRAILEMLRVARPGAPIVIVDEKEQGARVYELTLPGFGRGFEGRRPRIEAPVDLVPPTVEGLKLSDVWRGWFYCLEFRKPGLPAARPEPARPEAQPA